MSYLERIARRALGQVPAGSLRPASGVWPPLVDPFEPVTTPEPVAPVQPPSTAHAHTPMSSVTGAIEPPDNPRAPRSATPAAWPIPSIPSGEPTPERIARPAGPNPVSAAPASRTRPTPDAPTERSSPIPLPESGMSDSLPRSGLPAGTGEVSTSVLGDVPTRAPRTPFPFVPKPLPEAAQGHPTAATADTTRCHEESSAPAEPDEVIGAPLAGPLSPRSGRRPAPANRSGIEIGTLEVELVARPGESASARAAGSTGTPAKRTARRRGTAPGWAARLAFGLDQM